MLQKIRKNEDASHKQGHFLEIKTVIFPNTQHCKLRTNLRNKDGMPALAVDTHFTWTRPVQGLAP